MLLTFLLLAASLVVGFAFVSLLVPMAWRLTLAVWSSVFQLHTIAVFGVFPSLALLSSLTLWPEMARSRRVLAWVPIRFFVALLMFHAFSLFWSINVLQGIRTITYLLPFLFVFLGIHRMGEERPAAAARLIAGFCALALVEAVLVVAFRVSPAAESRFLQSGLARFFISSNVIDTLYTISRNNVFDPAKSGGFFVNANTAATFLGMSALVAWGVAVAYGMKWLRVVGFALWTSVFFTGSKAGIILAVVLPLGTYLLHSAGVGRIVPTRLLAALVALGAIAAAAWVGLERLAAQEFVYRTADSFGTRVLIWQHAVDRFLATPILGQGFGGWEKSFAVVAPRELSDRLPPHNTLIFIWSQSGLLAAMVAVAFVFSVWRFALGTLRSLSEEVRALGLASGVAVLWVFLGGFVDNSGLVGEIHMQPALAAILALSHARAAAVRAVGATNAQRPNLQAPTLQSI